MVNMLFTEAKENINSASCFGPLPNVIVLDENLFSQQLEQGSS